MIVGRTPDMLSHLQLSQANRSLATRLSTAGTELTTGIRSDLIDASGGNLRGLYGLESGIAELTTRTDLLSQASQRAGVTQAALQSITDITETLGPELLGAVGIGDLGTGKVLAEEARNAFGVTVHALNTEYGGRNLFSGTASDTAPLIAPETILADLQAAVDATATTADALAAIDTYFNDPAGGFYTSVYQGSADDAPRVDLGNGTSAAYASRADHDALRATMQALATAVMATDSSFSASGPAQLLMYQTAGDGLGDARVALNTLQHSVGVQEERIETAVTSTAAELSALELARSEIVAADPYETAALFTALEAQLGALYNVTVRLSEMSLSTYLR